MQQNNRKRSGLGIIPAIVLVLFGGVFFLIGTLVGNNFNEIKRTGEKVEACVLEAHSGGDGDASYTTLEITDTDSIYCGETITVSQYSSSAKTGDYVDVWYNGEDAILPGMTVMVTIFKVIGLAVMGIGCITLLVAIIKLVILGIAAGALYMSSQNNNQNINLNYNQRPGQPGLGYAQDKLANTNYNQQNSINNHQNSINNDYNQQNNFNYNQQNYNQNQ